MRGVVWNSQDRPSKGSASERIIQYLHRAGEPVALERIKLDLGVSGQSVSNAARHWTSYLHRTGRGLYAAVTEHLIPASVVIGMAAVERRIYSLPGMDDFVVRVHVLRERREALRRRLLSTEPRHGPDTVMHSPSATAAMYCDILPPSTTGGTG